MQPWAVKVPNNIVTFTPEYSFQAQQTAIYKSKTVIQTKNNAHAGANYKILFDPCFEVSMINLE